MVVTDRATGEWRFCRRSEVAPRRSAYRESASRRPRRRRRASPDKSLVRFLLDGGIQTFAVSWRNPTVEHRDWGLDTYIAALDKAVDAVRDITRADDISMMGSCSGGITSVAYLAGQRAKDQEPGACRVHARYQRGRRQRVRLAGHPGDDVRRKGRLAAARRARRR